jgi:cellulose synthase/poly-beta-1,6-N-acetylglucosamine synthase-like glycosyltransferase
MLTLLEWVLWVSVAMVVLVVVGYPALLALSWPFMRRTRVFGAAEPYVTLVIAAHNEEQKIAAKLDNCLGLEYPRERLEIVVASDGSTDRTNQITESYRHRGINLASFPRTGKTGVQNLVVAATSSEILVFSDANAMYRADAIRKLIRNFADPGVGCVCGQLVYAVDGEGAGAAESAYWTYEKFIKQCESDLSSAIGANGSIYAVRRSDYVPIDTDMISDLVLPLALVRDGKRVVYESEAVSVEEGSTDYAMEFRRKVRILTRSIRGLLRMRVLLNPFRYGVFAVQLIMHKLLRFLTPVFLISGAVALAGLAVLGRYQVWFVVAAVVGTIAALVAHRKTRKRVNIVVRILHLGYYYLMANCALALAWLNVLRGQRMTLWAPERRRSSSA